MAALNDFFQKVPQIKIRHHFAIAKPAAIPICKQKISQMHHIQTTILLSLQLTIGNQHFASHCYQNQTLLKKKFIMVIYAIKSSDLEYFEYRFQKLIYGVFFPLNFQPQTQICY